MFTDELWELLVTETNRYARQNNVNNWQDTSLEEMRCFIGFLYGTSINKVSQLDDVWSTDWVLASPAVVSARIADLLIVSRDFRLNSSI